MTKTIKTGIIAALIVVLLAVCGLFVGTLNTSAYAAEDPAVTAFETHVNENLKKDEYTENLFAEPAYVSAVKEAKDLYVGGASAEVMEIYNTVMAIFRDPLELESFATSTLYYRLRGIAGNKFLYSQNAELEYYEGIYNNYTDGSHEAVATYLNGVLGLTNNMTEARNKMDEIKGRIDTAVAAIAAIEYYDPTDKAMQVYDENDAAQYIVVDSEDSIGYKFENNQGVVDTTLGASKALKDIYGEILAEELAIVVDNYDIYEAAVAALNAQYAKAIAVIEQIAALGDVIDEDTCYTVRELVEGETGARATYDALLTENKAMDTADEVNYNDLQALVSNLTALTDIESRLETIDAAIEQVISDIEAIGTVAYTDASLALIETAEDGFAALDKDIRDNDTLEGQETFIVTNYSTMVAARAKYDEMQMQVDAVIAAIKGLNAFATEGNLYGEFIKVEKLYSALDTNQKNKVNTTPVTDAPQDYITNCSELYQYYQALANAIWTKVDPVVKAIADLGDVTITTEFSNKLTKAREMYDALTEQEQLAVSNYSDLVAKELAFAEAMEIADQWVEEVAAIETPVTITNMGKVTTAKATFDGLDANVQAVLQTGTYAETYAKYSDAVTALEDLLTEIETLADDMAALSTDEIALDENFATNIAAFESAVTPVKTAYDALAEDAKSYLQTQYAESYANYTLAIANYDQYHVEYLIVAIGAVDSITLAKAAAIQAARDAYDALSDALKAKVRNYAKSETLDPTLEAAEEKLAEFTGEYDAWIAAVNALVPEGTEVSALTSVNLKTIKDLETEYANFLEDVTGDSAAVSAVEKYLEEAKATLDAVKAQAFTLITELTAELKAIVAVPEEERYTAEYMAKLQAAAQAYAALDDTQKDVAYDNATDIAALLAAYEDFENIFVMQVLVTDYNAAVEALYKNVVTDGIYTADVEVMLNTLKAVYNSMTAYREVLADAYAKLGEVEAAFNAAKEAGNVLNLKDVNAALTEKIEKVFDDLTAAYAAADAALKAEIEGAIEDAVESLTTAYETADAALKDLIDETIADLATATQSITSLQTAFEGAKAALEAADAALRADLDAAIADIEALTEAYVAADGALKTELLAKITEQIDAVKALYAQADRDLKAALEEKITDDIAAAVAALTESYTAADNALKTAIEGTIAALEEAVADDFEELEASFTAAKTAIEAAIKAEEDARKEADADLQAQLDAALKRIEELEANKASKWLGIIALIAGIIGTVGAVWFIINKFAGKKD